MDISETGKNLSVLIATEPGKNWETFCTWYSIYKNLPEASVAIASQRNGQVPFEFFQWAKRLKIPIFHHDPLTPDDNLANLLDATRNAKIRRFIGNYILILPCLTVVIDVLDTKSLHHINTKKIWIDDHVLFLNLEKTSPDDLLNDHLLNGDILLNYTSEEIGEGKLCVEAKESEKIASIVSFRNGCGKWIDTSKGCPLSSAAGLALTTMTVNESRVIELWKKMCTLYSATV